MKFFTCVVYSCLLTFVLLLHGPAADQQHRYRYTEEDNNDEPEENEECDDIGLSSKYEYSNEDTPFTKSYCLDRNLYWPSTDFSDMNKGNEYYDHCCYVRFQREGKVLHGCKGLKEIDYLDIKETAYKFEQQYNIKVFEVLCNSSYTYLSVAVIISLLGLLL